MIAEYPTVVMMKKEFLEQALLLLKISDKE
jgi:hypothetical protein